MLRVILVTLARIRHHFGILSGSRHHVCDFSRMPHHFQNFFGQPTPFGDLLMQLTPVCRITISKIEDGKPKIGKTIFKTGSDCLKEGSLTDCPGSRITPPETICETDSDCPNARRVPPNLRAFAHVPDCPQ